MTRRRQKFSRTKTRTAWLTWLAWGIMGSIFGFEDIRGGSGWLTVIMTSPFWILFIVWPFLWLWLVNQKNAALVEIDEDISTDTDTARLVQKDGVRYVEAPPFLQTFHINADMPTVLLPGGDEHFVELETVRQFAKNNEKLKKWLDVVDSISIDR